MSPSAIYSKSGKGVQEASGKTSLLPRAERAVLSAFDGKMTLQEVAEKVGKPYDAKFQELITKLDNDGFVRQVSAGSPAPAGTPARPAPAKPAAKAGGGGGALGEDLDFTIAVPSAPKAAPKPVAAAAPPVAPHMAQSNAAAFARAREEAEEKAARERERIKSEAEAKMRSEMEAKARSEAEIKAKADAEARVKAETEAKIKAARDAAVKAAAEAKAKADEEARKAREEAEAKLEAERARAREAEEKARREAEEARRQAEEARRQAEEAKRKAEEEARKAREEAERIRKEAEEAKRKAEEEARKVREEAERRRKEEEARRAREEQERKEREARERQEREAREKADAERRAREDQERKDRDARERQERERDDEKRRVREGVERAEREQREQDARDRREREEREAAEREKAAAKAKAEAKPESFGDSLLADLDSFSKHDDDERKSKEEAARKEKEATQRKREEAEREAKEKDAREAKERDAREAREKADREARDKARAEEERRAEEEARKAREEDDRRRRAKAEAKPAGDDDIPLSDDDLDMDEVKKDEAALSKEARRAAREREERERQAKKDAKREARRAKEEEKEDKKEKKEKARREEPVATPQFRRPRKWGKMVSTTLFVVLIGGLIAIHVMPVSTAEYESAASQALGRPVKVSSANLSLYSGVQLKFSGVSVGDTKIATVRGFPEIGSLFDPKKRFTRIELEGVTVPQESLAGLFGARIRGDNFSVGRVLAKQVKLTGPLTLPPLEVDLALAEDGNVTSTSVRGPEGLSGKITPKGAGELDLDIVAHSFTVPVLPDFSMSGFAMKGIATPTGLRIESWGGSSLDGAVSGSANVRWSSGNWVMDGVLTIRGINAAVFAPALLSEGKAEGTGRFSFNDADPMAFLTRGRIEGTYSVHKGVLGSFDLSRAIQTGGRQAQGRTPFTGLTGQGVFDKGAVALRNVSFNAGAMNAGASADISADGNLSGRIVADIRTAAQTLRATLNLGGTVKDPQVRN